MVVVVDIVGVEMEERRNRRSSHPYALPIGGACTKTDSRSADRNGKQKKTDLQKNIKSTVCVGLLDFAGHGESYHGQGREEKRKPFQTAPCLRGF
jgi:hypothetical protein